MDGTSEFDALISPHRSLSAAGVRRLLMVLGGLGAAISAVAWTLGGWPVLGFSGAELVLAGLLLRRHARGHERLEHIRLAADGLHVRRTGGAGKDHAIRLDPSWVQAILQERPGRAPALLLVARGQQTEVASWLGEAEKRDLALALQAALHRFRNPRFDNPQLRDG